MKTFTISDKELDKLNQWLKNDVYPWVIEHQRKTTKNPDKITKSFWDQGMPYEGAIGGGLHIIFIPTSIGNIVKARYKTYDHDFETDLTDYDTF
jgi:hypothetical protein